VQELEFSTKTPQQTQTTLQNIAAKKLVELQSDSTGTPISTLMTMGYQYNVGDFINIYRPKYMLWGNWYRIVQMAKSKIKVRCNLISLGKQLRKPLLTCGIGRKTASTYQAVQAGASTFKALSDFTI